MSARIRQRGRVLPFLIEDLTPYASRVPAGRAAEHPNGATGISGLLIAVRDASEARRSFFGLTGRDSEGPEDAFRIVRHELAFLVPETTDDSVERRLRTLGPGALAVEIVGGAKIRLGQPE